MIFLFGLCQNDEQERELMAIAAVDLEMSNTISIVSLLKDKSIYKWKKVGKKKKKKLLIILIWTPGN